VAVRSLEPPCPRIARGPLHVSVGPLAYDQGLPRGLIFTKKITGRTDSGRRCRGLFFESTYIEEKNVIRDGGSVSFKYAANHGPSLETELAQKNSQLSRRRPYLTCPYLAPSLPHGVDRGSDATH